MSASAYIIMSALHDGMPGQNPRCVTLNPFAMPLPLQYFNAVQSECFATIIGSDQNVVRE